MSGLTRKLCKGIGINSSVENGNRGNRLYARLFTNMFVEGLVQHGARGGVCKKKERFIMH